MSKKVRIKEIKKMVGGNDINGLFEEMMGMKDADPSIIKPKFVNARNTIRHIYKVLIQFSQFVAFRNDFPEIETGLNQIADFAEKIKDSIYFNPTEEEKEEKYDRLSKVEINSLYKKLKENDYVKSLIMLCGILKQYSRYLNDKDNLKDNFIGQEPGLSLTIFQFSTFDLKVLWANQKINSMVKKYVLNVLHIIWKDTYNLYKIVTSPDVNIEEFTKLLIESIARLKKQPGLNRCNNAFNRIEQSVDLLKDKFDDYYRQSIASSNPNIIIESFIIDVSNQGGANAKLTREFRTIIQYMHKVSEQTGKNKDPNVQKLFNMLNRNFEVMDKQTRTTDDSNNDETTETANTADDNNNETTNTDDSNTAETKTNVEIYIPLKKSLVKKNKRKKKKRKVIEDVIN